MTAMAEIYRHLLAVRAQRGGPAAERLARATLRALRGGHQPAAVLKALQAPARRSAVAERRQYLLKGLATTQDPKVRAHYDAELAKLNRS